MAMAEKAQIVHMTTRPSGRVGVSVISTAAGMMADDTGTNPMDLD